VEWRTGPAVDPVYGGRTRSGTAQARSAGARLHSVLRSGGAREQIVDRWDYDFSCRHFLGDAFPQLHPNFGPGVIAAFLGCQMGIDPQAGTCWFHPEKTEELAALRLQYDPDNIWLRRVKAISQAAMDRCKAPCSSA